MSVYKVTVSLHRGDGESDGAKSNNSARLRRDVWARFTPDSQRNQDQNVILVRKCGCSCDKVWKDIVTTMWCWEKKTVRGFSWWTLWILNSGDGGDQTRSKRHTDQVTPTGRHRKDQTQTDRLNCKQFVWVLTRHHVATSHSVQSANSENIHWPTHGWHVGWSLSMKLFWSFAVKHEVTRTRFYCRKKQRHYFCDRVRPKSLEGDFRLITSLTFSQFGVN